MKTIDGKIKKLKIHGNVLFLCIILIYAFPEKGYTQLGIKTGTTTSNFYYTDINLTPYKGFDVDLRPYLGFDIELVQLGAQKPLLAPYISTYYTFKLTQRLGLRPELVLTQKGVNFNQFDYERSIYKVVISYLEIPVSVTYQLLQKESSIIEIYSGGCVAFKINSIKKVASNTSSVEKITINSVNIFEGGIHLGINYKHKFFDDFILFDLRIFTGLSNIFKPRDDWTSIYFHTQKTKITGLNLSIGYEF